MDEIKGITWNVDGIQTMVGTKTQGPNRRATLLYRLIAKQKYTIIALQETHMREQWEVQEVEQDFRNLGYGITYTLVASYRKGGLLTAVRDDYAITNSYTTADRILHTTIRGPNGQECTIVNIHAPNNPKERKEMWRLIGQREQEGGHRLLMGDMNSLMTIEDTDGKDTRWSANEGKAMDEEEEVIRALGLRDSWTATHGQEERRKGSTRDHTTNTAKHLKEEDRQNIHTSLLDKHPGVGKDSGVRIF